MLQKSPTNQRMMGLPAGDKVYSAKRPVYREDQMRYENLGQVHVHLARAMYSTYSTAINNRKI
jgi:hypothetical protein